MAEAVTLNLPETLKCVCGAPLLCFWGKRGKRYNVHHPIRPNGGCLHRFTIFGYGPTEDEAWACARQAIEDFKTKTS